MNAEAEEVYSINKRLLSRLGGWPYQRKVLKVLLPTVIITIDMSGVVSVVLLMFNHSNDIDIIIEGFITIVIIIAVVIKLINLAVNNGKLKHLLRLMNDHWTTFNSKSELHILRYYADTGCKMAKYYAVFLFIILLILISIPLAPRLLDIMIPLNESRSLIYLYQGDYGIDKEKYYYLIWLHNCVAGTVGVMITMNVDILYIMCVLHACSLFVAIGHCLENIASKNDIETNVDVGVYANSSYFLAENAEKLDSVDDYSEILACLKKHQLALEYVEKLNSMFSSATFALLIMNLLVISLIGIQVINNLGQKDEIMKWISLISGVLFHFTGLCLLGQLIIDRSAEVFNKAYSSRWYMFSVRSKRLLRILLYRSFVPSMLTAGNMYVMSMITYSMVMQTAMSYFTAFLSMK